MNCIFICIFNNENYIKLFYLLLESIYIYGNLDENTKLVVYTSTPFMEIIKQSHLYNNNIIFEINDTYNTIDTACKARLDLFQLPSITKFDKILYLDTDIIIKNDMNPLFSTIEEDILYVLEEGTIDHPMDCWGKTLFGDEINDYDDKTAFTSGILLFNNCEKIRNLFIKIKQDIIDRPYHFECYDQPYIVYNAFKYNLYNKVLLKSFAINNDTDIYSDKIIHHFPGGPGIYEKKLDIMQQFLTNLKDYTIINNIQKTKEYINEHLFPILNNCNELVEGNIFMLHHTNDYSDMFLNKSKNISNLVLNKNITNVMEIGFNAGFSTLLMLLSNPKLKITCFDLGEHSYTLPCYEKIKELVGEDRIKIIIGDSTQTIKNINETYQLIHIDGGHSTDVADSDIIESIRLSANNTILIMDDYDFPNLHELWDRYINNYKLQKLDIFIYNSPHHDIKYIKKSNIPKIFIQTSIEKPNNDIIQQIKKQCPEWEYIHYNDNDILDFFINNPIDELPNIIDKFNAITSGAHKADLFRYYFLYLKGGFFMDSDAMIYENIETIIKDYNFVSVQSNSHTDCIFQGILGCSPKNKIIKEALWQAYNTDPQLLQSDYHYWCKQLYTILQNNSFDYNIKLFRERRISNTYDEIINDTNTILFKHFWKTKVILYDDILSSEFTNIYKNNLWLSGSGTGSFKENTIEYNEFIINFIKNNNINSITDIGCGDWQSSHLIYNQLTNIDYLGIDCVDFVIQQNKEKYPNYKFTSMNILNNLDSIRDSEIYILKDILQHWTIKDIYSMIDKLLSKKFKCIIITNNANQNSDNLELNSVVSGRGLHSNYLPLRKYNAIPILDYYGGENKHLCIIQNNYTNWNEYNKEQINNFDYIVLTSYEIPNKLIRVGPKEDGGYIIADGLKYDLFISCGIANDIRFEEAFLDMYKTKCYAFDGTISQFPYHTNNIEWIPKNIGYINTKKTTNLQEYIKNNHNIFLKMDIEGSEFNWIDSLSIEDLYRFSQIVIEFHWPFDIYRMNMLKKLNETHYIIHIHGNNYCDRDIPKGLPSGRSYDGTANINNTDLQQISLPEVFEVTYINKKCFNETSVINKKEIKYPINLDYPNNPNAPDIAFSIPLE